MNPRCYSVCRQLQLHDPTAKLTSDFPREIQQSTRLTHIDYSLNWCHLKLTYRQLSEGQIRISQKNAQTQILYMQSKSQRTRLSQQEQWLYGD